MKSKFFYGWVIALASGFGIACSFAVFIPSTIGLLIGPLAREFHWTAQQIVTANLLTTIAAVIVGPFVGALIDGHGARKIIVVSLLLEALVLLSFRYLNDSLMLFYARYVLLALLASGGTAIGFTRIVTQWFRRRRGLALGLALAGTGVGGVAWSLAAGALFASVGWRDAFLYFAGFIALIATPLLALVLRDNPAAMGLTVDGDEVPVNHIPRAETGLTVREAAGTRQFWLLLAVALLMGFGVYGIMINLVPIVKKAGDPNNMAALIQASLWAALVVGRVSTGVLLDRFFAPRLALIFTFFPMAGAAMFATGASGQSAFVAAMLVGLAAGAEVDTFAYMVSRYFGLMRYGSIYALCFSAFGLGVGIGPVVMARIAEQNGSYAPALWTATAALAIAAVMLMTFRRFPSWDAPGANAGFGTLAPAAH